MHEYLLMATIKDPGTAIEMLKIDIPSQEKI
jgi:hypothetical protein